MYVLETARRGGRWERGTFVYFSRKAAVRAAGVRLILGLVRVVFA